MSNDNDVSIDRLVLDELDGKAAALSGYDESLWKIRSGYAVLLYGSVGLVVGLVDKNFPDVSSSILCAVGLLVLGFSVFGAFMDYSFMVSKLRVVTHRDILMSLAYDKAVSGSWSVSKEQLLDSLKNSGERKQRIDWKERTGRGRLIIYYGGTFLVCISAILVLI